jgi:phosphohistidine phosphatase
MSSEVTISGGIPMKVYLAQHGEARPEAEDPERPLTEKGRYSVESVAGYIGALGLEVAEIVHSGRLRAKQTAEIFADRLVPAKGVREERGLGPTDDPAEAKRLIELAERPLMIVGHLPHLSRLASLVILGEIENKIIYFKNGGVVCLNENDSRWLIDWVLVPEVIHK